MSKTKRLALPAILALAGVLLQLCSVVYGNQLRAEDAANMVAAVSASRYQLNLTLYYFAAAFLILMVNGREWLRAFLEYAGVAVVTLLASLLFQSVISSNALPFGYACYASLIQFGKYLGIIIVLIGCSLFLKLYTGKTKNIPTGGSADCA